MAASPTRLQETHPAADGKGSDPRRAKREGARRGTSKNQATPEWAREAVTAACLSARRNPQEWGPAPVRIDLRQKERLRQRIADDFKATGHRFAMNHYLTAAMQAIPEDPETALQWAEDYLDRLGLERPRTEGTTTRLRLDVAERMRELTMLLPLTGRYGLVGYVQMAALARLLDALDTLDETKSDQAVVQ